MRVLHSPQESVRRAFDLMPLESETDWQVVAARLQAVQSALWRDCAPLCTKGSRGRWCRRRRQVEACAAQCDTWGGRDDGHSSYFARLVGGTRAVPVPTGLERGARVAPGPTWSSVPGCASDYLPGAAPADPVGRDLYSVAARYFTGSELDLEDTYRVRVVRAASHRGPDVVGLRADRARESRSRR